MNTSFFVCFVKCDTFDGAAYCYCSKNISKAGLSPFARKAVWAWKSPAIELS